MRGLEYGSDLLGLVYNFLHQLPTVLPVFRSTDNSCLKLHPDIIRLMCGLLLVGLGRFALAEEVRFNRDVLPILSDTCFTCHGPDANSREAELRLDVEAEAKAARDGVPAIAPFQPGGSELIRRILSDDPDTVMPPPDSARQLSETDKAKLRRWIEQGARWEEHWAFMPPQRPHVPMNEDAGWARNPIDHFVLARLEREGLSPSPEAEKTKLIRRLSLDLTGLPPTVEMVQAFVADERPDAYERLVDQLIASPHYGEMMALPWLEAARFADTDGYQYDGPRYMWRWRDWVIDAFNAKHALRSVHDRAAGGRFAARSPRLEQIESRPASIEIIGINSEAGSVVEEFLLEYVASIASDTVSMVWLGLTAGLRPLPRSQVRSNFSAESIINWSRTSTTFQKQVERLRRGTRNRTSSPQRHRSS